MTADFGEKRLELEYPCAWTYTLIGTSEERLREVVAQILVGLEHRLRPSNRSAGGKYVSLSLEMTVTSEAQRLAIFGVLADHEDVRFVI